MDEVHRQQIKRMLPLYDISFNLSNQSALLGYIVLCVCNFINIILDNIATNLVATPNEPDIVQRNIPLLLETPFTLILLCNKEKTVMYITTKPLQGMNRARV